LKIFHLKVTFWPHEFSKRLIDKFYCIKLTPLYSLNQKNQDNQHAEKEAVLDTTDATQNDPAPAPSKEQNGVETEKDDDERDADDVQDEMSVRKEDTPLDDADESLFGEPPLERRADRDDGSKVSTNGTASSSGRVNSCDGCA
jgi:hypothetical protein